ncbi:MAG: dihydropteroate synthase [Chloroflexi bacterium]|jgi:5-methyltetrahydrofolate corrinoid/iron sulfur protein methyltransferase|nr:dihydropteroate synthase [Chloroflexota bacterium]
MFIVGENIHIISPRVKKAIQERDAATIQELAKAQVASGADVLDLNIGPQKKSGPEVMTWMVNTVQEVVDVRLSFDTTNLAAIETGLKLAKRQAIINSTSAEPERLEKVPLLAAEYDAKLIALMMGKSGIPLSAEERVSIALDQLVPRAMEVGIPMENLYLDPLVLTVAGCQEYCPHAIEAVRYVKQGLDPAPITICGLSNVSNNVPTENRSLLNRVYLVMLMAAGLDAAIADPLDDKLRDVIRIVEQRDDSTGAGALLLALYDATAAMEELEPSQVDMSDPEQVDIWKTVQVLLNKTIFSEAYLRM